VDSNLSMQPGLFNQALPTRFTKVFGLVSLTAFSASAIAPQPSYAQNANFYCGQSNGYPTTFARTQSGKQVPVIRWVSEVANLTQQERCQIVSQRFQKNFDNGTLKYITTGVWKGHPIICAVARLNGACRESTLLFTLKPGSDANAVLLEILDKRGLAAGRVHSESDENTVNIDFDKYLRNVQLE
jgi:Circadian oscillating protein COP23